MDGAKIELEASVWLWTSNGASWHFLTVEGEAAAEIRYASMGMTRGFGSVPVEATIGRTHWRTSLFPSKSAGGFMLPLKAAVRRAEGFGEGDSVRVILKV
jgi:hypothetical protein